MSSCNFYGNHGGQNVLSYAALEGGPSKIIIDHCTFFNNNYSNALVKLDVQTKVLVISNINFTVNVNKGGIIYLLVYSTNLMLAMVNINFERNFDSLAGGVIVRLISNEYSYSIIRASKLNFTNNQFIGSGGGINILGTFQESCQIYIKILISLTILDLVMDLLSIAL